MVVDIGHQWGADLEVSPTGDLATIGGASEATQRIIRRLLTNPGDYIWNLGYGAGLAGFVGKTTPGAQIEAIARSQMMREPAVAKSPPPEIELPKSTGRDTGTLALSIRYVDATSGQQNSVTIPLTG
jgi:hypothetical protein